MRLTPFATIVVACALIRSVSAQISLDAVQRDGYGVVPISRPEPNVLTVMADINGHKAKLIIDTGWSEDGIALDSDYAKFVKQHVQGELKGSSLTGQKLTETRGVAESVTIGNVRLMNVPVGFSALAPAREQNARKSVGADGFMTSGFLKTCSAILDLHNLRLYLRPPGKGRPVDIGPALREIGFAEAPFGYSSHLCYVMAQINGVEAALQIDTGSFGGLIDPHFATKAHAYGYTQHMLLKDAAGREAEYLQAHLDSFKLGGIEPKDASRIGVTDYVGYADSHGKLVGLLGMDMLGPNGTIMNFGTQKLYFFKK